MKGKILYTWIPTCSCTLTAKFIVMQVPHPSDCCRFKKGFAAGEYKSSNVVLLWFSLELGFGEGDEVVLLSLLNFCTNLRICCSIGMMLKLQIDLWNFRSLWKSANSDFQSQ